MGSTLPHLERGGSVNINQTTLKQSNMVDFKKRNQLHQAATSSYSRILLLGSPSYITMEQFEWTLNQWQRHRKSPPQKASTYQTPPTAMPTTAQVACCIQFKKLTITSSVTCRCIHPKRNSREIIYCLERIRPEIHTKSIETGNTTRTKYENML